MKNLWVYGLAVSFALWGCGDNSSDDDAAESGNDTVEETQGALAVGSVNLRELIESSNKQLTDAGKAKLAVDESYLEDLPEGSLSIDVEGLSLAEADKGPISVYKWFIKTLKLSTDGSEWVDVYSGDPVPFDIISGTSAADGISAKDVPPGTYPYIYMETTDIHWQRGGTQCSQGTMNVNLAAILTTRDEVKQYYDGLDVFDVMFNYDGSTYPDIQTAIDNSDNEITDQYDYIGSQVQTTPESLATKGGISKSSGLEFDEMYFYLHAPVTVTAGETAALVLSVVPTADLSSDEDCDAAPGKPRFLVGSETDITDAISFLGEKEN